MNIALPYQDLTIMDACLACGVNYMDTANYEPENTDDPAWRAVYEKRCKEAYPCGQPCAGAGKADRGSLSVAGRQDCPDVYKRQAIRQLAASKREGKSSLTN